MKIDRISVVIKYAFPKSNTIVIPGCIRFRIERIKVSFGQSGTRTINIFLWLMSLNSIKNPATTKQTTNTLINM
ncbi:hypothetical protein HZS_245 [Henneguya salminicola]|nr:hypothetical protein HZS_245 [Henneguya salminicola]